MVLADVSSKDDLGTLKREIDASLRELELRMTIKIGAIVPTAVAVIAAVQKLV